MPFDDPDSAPRPQPAAPRADHTNLPADEPIWEAARRSYVEDGLSCPVVAERHGLHVRTVQHHAANEDWPALRARYGASEVVRRRETERLGDPDDPASAILEAARADRLADLLVHVSGDGLVREAARQAAEAAAARRPQETLHWLRVVREAERMSERIDRALAGRDPIEAFRAEYVRGFVSDLDTAREAAQAEAASLASCHLDRAK